MQTSAPGTPGPGASPAAPARARRTGAVRLVVVAVLVVCGIGAVAAFAFSRGGERGEVPTTAELHTVAATSFDITVLANGELEAKQQTEIRSELEKPAAIVEVIAEGTRVKKGDVLVRLSAEQLETDRVEEESRVASARSELVNAENQYLIQVNENEAAQRQAHLKVEIAEIDLRKFLEGDDTKSTREFELELDLARRNVDQRRDQYEEAQKLFERGFASSDELKDADKAHVEAQARLVIAEGDLRVYIEYERGKQFKTRQSDVDEAKAELERVQRKNESQLASKEADRENKKRQLMIREEKYAKIVKQLNATTVIAPTDGLVVYGTNTVRGRGFMMMGGSGPIQVGREVSPNELIMILPATANMVASVRVHESIAGRLQPGQAANIKVDAMQGRSFAGTVDSIGVIAESDGWRDPNLREYTVKVAISEDNSAGLLKPSMRCESEIVLGRVDNALAVPVQAVFREGPVTYVHKPRSGKYERIPIRAGRRSATMIEVAAGLNSGDRVLLRQPTPGEVIDAKFDEATLASLMPAMPEGFSRGMPAGAPGAPGNGAQMQFVSAPGGAQPTMVMQADGAPGQAGGERRMTINGPDGKPREVKVDEKQIAEWRKRAAEQGGGRNRREGAPANGAAPSSGGSHDAQPAPAPKDADAAKPGGDSGAGEAEAPAKPE